MPSDVNSSVTPSVANSSAYCFVSACFGLLAVSLLPTLIGLAGSIYFIGALVAGGGLAVFGALQAREPSTTSARRVLFASLFYLPAVLALLALDKR